VILRHQIIDYDYFDFHLSVSTCYRRASFSIYLILLLNQIPLFLSLFIRFCNVFRGNKSRLARWFCRGDRNVFTKKKRKNIQSIRKSCPSRTQERFAEHIDVSRETVSNFECCSVMISTHTAQSCNISTDYISVSARDPAHVKRKPSSFLCQQTGGEIIEISPVCYFAETNSAKELSTNVLNVGRAVNSPASSIMSNKRL